MKRKFYFAASLVALIGALGVASVVVEKPAAVQAAGPMAPRFEVDPMWPKPLPNHWLLGMVIGVAIDDKDNIWVVHRQGSLENNEKHCCTAAPPVLKFNQAGDLIGHWGGPGTGYDWPLSMHGITIDYKGNVWLGANGSGTPPPASAGGEAGIVEGLAPYRDNQILKMTQDGKFLMQIGKPNQSKGSNDTDNVKGVAQTLVDPQTNELYVADGYGNKRVIVFDSETGKYKRHWGAYGNKPDDKNPGPYNPDAPPAQQFRNPVHCVTLSVDRLLYVCDRVNDRIQVFKTDGTFVKEVFIEKQTKGNGSVWEIALSKDPQQTYMYLTDGDHSQVHILLRSTLEVLTSFGDGGRQPGLFYAPHSIAADSKGNLFTTETFRGQRIQKFLYKGLAPVTAKEQGPLWPKTAKSPLK